ncbi:MAG: redoxin domain-containing protein [Phycisphaerales bacterium]|nr:redoxin domain-containing protein [Phycisphaerales bacterium]
MKNVKLLSLFAASTAALAIATGASAQNTKPEKPAKEAPATQPEKDHGKDEKGAKGDKGEKAPKATAGVEPGQPAPAFTLKDTEGKETTLAEHIKAGKIVVLQWFNPECPFVAKHYKETKTFNDLATTYAPKGVVFLAINSGAPGDQGAGARANTEAKKNWAIPYPVLLDEAGAVGRAYGAKNTPTMVVIGKEGNVAYFGAIDDDSGAAKPGKTNYVAKALDELLAGSNVTTPKTKPYGCAVKYGKSKG